MNGSSEREQQLADYLLGQLSEEQRVEIEDRLFIDDQLYEELRATSDDLIHAYLEQELSAEDRARFEQHFLASPRRRERVAFIRDLMTAVRPEGATGAAQGAPRARSSVRPLSLAAGLFLAAAAAILILLVRAGERSAPQAKTTPPPVTTARGPSPLSSEEARHTEAPPHIKAAPSPAARKPRQPDVMLVRLPEASDDTARELTLSDARIVRLEVSLPERRAPSYDAVIRTADGGEAWRGEGLVALAGQPLVIDVPAEALASGDYVVALDGEPFRRALPAVPSHREYRLSVRRP